MEENEKDAQFMLGIRNTASYNKGAFKLLGKGL